MSLETVLNSGHKVWVTQLRVPNVFVCEMGKDDQGNQKRDKQASSREASDRRESGGAEGIS